MRWWVQRGKVIRRLGWQVKELQLSSSHPAQNAEASEKQLSGVKIYIRESQAGKRIPARKRSKKEKTKQET